MRRNLRELDTKFQPAAAVPGPVSLVKFVATKINGGFTPPDIAPDQPGLEV